MRELKDAVRSRDDTMRERDAHKLACDEALALTAERRQACEQAEQERDEHKRQLQELRNAHKEKEREKVLNQVRGALSKHPAAFPEIVVTSSEKGWGIPTLRAIIATLE